eukprot:2137690-Lingulodinium_polyedra.AAC.1
MALIAGHASEVMTAVCVQHTCMDQDVGTTLPELVGLTVLGVVVEVTCGRALEPGCAAQEPPVQC